MTTVPLADQLACVQRELRLRHRVYPRFVAQGRMTQVQMDKELACMQAVLETLQGLDAQPSLFAETRGDAYASQKEALRHVQQLLDAGEHLR